MDSLKISASDIRRAWPFGAIETIQRLRGGAINKTFKISTTDGVYVLRVYTQKQEREIQFEVALLNYLRGLPVPRAMPIGGKSVLSIGLLPAIAYQYLSGEPQKTFSKSERVAIGAFLLDFHITGRGFMWRGKRNALYDFPPGKSKDLECVVTSHFSENMLVRFMKIRRDMHAHRPPRALPRGPIHVDVKPGNVLFHKGKLSGVIDFDNAYIGPFLLDLAKSMVWFGLEKNGFNMQKARDVYIGYVRKRKLTPLEYKELYRMMRFAFASHMYVDFYMKAAGKIPAAYFNFLMNDFYTAYLSFSRMSERRFYELLDKKND